MSLILGKFLATQKRGPEEGGAKPPPSSSPLRNMPFHTTVRTALTMARWLRHRQRELLGVAHLRGTGTQCARHRERVGARGRSGVAGAGTTSSATAGERQRQQQSRREGQQERLATTCPDLSPAPYSPSGSDQNQGKHEQGLRTGQAQWRQSSRCERRRGGGRDANCDIAAGGLRVRRNRASGLGGSSSTGETHALAESPFSAHT